MTDDLDAHLGLALNPLGGDAETRMRERSVRYLLDHADVSYLRVVDALESAPSGLAVPALIELLARFGRPETIPILRRLLERGAPSVARAAGQALGRTGGDGVTAVLVEALASSLSETAIGAADGLLLRGDSGACHALLKATYRDDPDVRYHAAQAAIRLDCLNDADYKRLCQDSYSSVRELVEKRAK